MRPLAQVEALSRAMPEAPAVDMVPDAGMRALDNQ